MAVSIDSINVSHFYYLHHSHVNENVKAGWGCRGHLGNIYAENSSQAKPWKMDRISTGRENKRKTFQALEIKVERFGQHLRMVNRPI